MCRKKKLIQLGVWRAGEACLLHACRCCRYGFYASLSHTARVVVFSSLSLRFALFSIRISLAFVHINHAASTRKTTNLDLFRGYLDQYHLAYIKRVANYLFFSSCSLHRNVYFSLVNGVESAVNCRAARIRFTVRSRGKKKKKTFSRSGCCQRICSQKCDVRFFMAHDDAAVCESTVKFVKFA